MPRRQVNIHPGKKSVILCIDPDSDSDVVIEEGDTDLKMRCLIVKSEKETEEDAGEQADNEESKVTEEGE